MDDEDAAAARVERKKSDESRQEGTHIIHYIGINV